jgi:hypothetical protein
MVSRSKMYFISTECLRRVAAALILLLVGHARAQERIWQRMHVPGYAETAQQFKNPLPEYGLVMWWWWNGDMTEDQIVRDLRDIKAHHVNGVMLWAYYGLGIEYLSEKWFERVRFAVEQARRLDMRVWLMDEGSYPSGFVGGNITRSHPELRMQVLAAAPPVAVHGPQRISIPLPANLVAVTAKNKQTGERLPLAGSTGTTLEWSAPSGDWEVSLVRHEFRTSPTRYVHTPGFVKDGRYSFLDPLNPAGARQFLADVHDQYKKYIGPEFGRTVMGFMGDEPSVAGPPWTASLGHEFQRRKGYELVTTVAELFDRPAIGDTRLRRADYFDVWTDLYSEHFFKPQTDWCDREKLEYIVHLCGEEDLNTLTKLNGDYFKCNRTVQIPGVDAIWRQLWPDKVMNYPKLASSASHLRGRPRAFTESFGVYGAGLSIEQAKWVMDYQLVRGINHFQAMGYSSSNAEFRQTFGPPNWSNYPQWPYFTELAIYANRLLYLLSVGRPSAEVALYYPTTSGWLGDFKPEKSMLAAGQELLEHQRDFDYIDEDGLQSLTAVKGGTLVNHSEQRYRAVVVAGATAVSKSALATLEQFAGEGGTVVFLAPLPSVIPGRTYLQAETGAANPLVRDGVPRFPSVMIEPSGLITPAVLSKLPPPDVALSPPQFDVKYLHRSLRDAEVFFFFNEADRLLNVTARLRAAGRAEIWDPVSGARLTLTGTRHGDSVSLPLTFEPFETKLIILSPRPEGTARAVAAQPSPDTALVLDGEWRLDLAGQRYSTGLKLWSDLGHASYFGAASYKKDFTLDGGWLDAQGPLWLDLGNVRYAATVKLNGGDLGRRAWRPFRWDIRAAAHRGANLLEVDVSNTRANELAGDPAKYREIDAKGWVRNSYISGYLKFDVEMVPSGLVGPVRIMRSR